MPKGKERVEVMPGFTAKELQDLVHREFMRKKEPSVLIFECKKHHRWVEHIKLPMPIDAFLARMKGFSICPTCEDSKPYMLLGDKYREAYKELLGKELPADVRAPFEGVVQVK